MHIFHRTTDSHTLTTCTTEESCETVTVNAQGEIIHREPFRLPVLHQPLPGDLELELALIPNGYSVMGSPHSVGYQDEKPPHSVHVKAFFLSRTTITQNQWQAVIGRLPPCRGKGLDFPVDRVSWNDALRFSKRLAALTGLPYRLPSEAEWEYACRAGTATDFCFGDMITTDLANYVGLHPFAGGPKGEYRHGPIPSRQFSANRFGLFDMHGNLWEWCTDTWHESYAGAPADGEAWVHGGTDERVLRGGSWHDPPDLCRSACRLKLKPTEGEDYVGVRIALSADMQSSKTLSTAS
jgi:formylglycine-generating enzyme required for sulfatase activity